MKKKIKFSSAVQGTLTLVCLSSISGCQWDATATTGAQRSPTIVNNSDPAKVVGLESSNGTNQLTEELLITIRDRSLHVSDPSRVTKAIEKLGEMKAKAAVEDLSQILTFKGKFEGEDYESSIIINHPIPRSALYPATTALFGIGKPSLPALARVVQSNEIGTLASDNAIATIKLIFRENVVEGAEYLEGVAAKNPSPEEVGRLMHAAGIVGKQPPQ